MYNKLERNKFQLWQCLAENNWTVISVTIVQRGDNGDCKKNKLIKFD